MRNQNPIGIEKNIAAELNVEPHSCGIEKHDGFEQVCGKIAHSNVVVEPVEILTKNGTGKRAE